MKKKEFKEILDYLFGEIHGIDTHRICYDDYNYEENINIIVDHLRSEEDTLRIVFPEYDILTTESSQLNSLLSKLSSASILYKEIDNTYFYHEMLLNKEIIGKIIFHKILKESRKFKINNLLS